MPNSNPSEFGFSVGGDWVQLEEAFIGQPWGVNRQIRLGVGVSVEFRHNLQHPPFLFENTINQDTNNIY